MRHVKFTRFQALEILRVAGEFLTHLHRYKRTYDNTDERCRDTYLQDVEQSYVEPCKHTEKCHHSCRDGRSRYRLLRCNNRNTKRSLGAYLGFCCNLGYHRQHRIGHMAGTCKKRKGICNQRSKYCNILRVFAKYSLSQFHHIIETAGGLHAGRCRNYGSNHQHYIYRQFPGFKPEHEGEHSNAYSTHHTQADTTQAGTDYYKKENQ